LNYWFFLLLGFLDGRRCLAFIFFRNFRQYRSFVLLFDFVSELAAYNRLLLLFLGILGGLFLFLGLLHLLRLRRLYFLFRDRSHLDFRLWSCKFFNERIHYLNLWRLSLFLLLFIFLRLVMLGILLYLHNLNRFDYLDMFYFRLLHQILCKHLFPFLFLLLLGLFVRLF